MSKKVTSTDLEKLIKEALLSEDEGINLRDFKSLYRKARIEKNMQDTESANLPKSPEDFFNEISPLDGNSGTISKEDILWYIKKDDEGQYLNLNKITTAVESKLLTFKYLGDETTLEAEIATLEMKKDKYERSLSYPTRKAMRRRLDSYDTFYDSLLKKVQSRDEKLEQRDNARAINFREVSVATDLLNKASDKVVSFTYVNKAGEQMSYEDKVSNVDELFKMFNSHTYRHLKDEAEKNKLESTLKSIKEYVSYQEAKKKLNAAVAQRKALRGKSEDIEALEAEIKTINAKLKGVFTDTPAIKNAKRTLATNPNHKASKKIMAAWDGWPETISLIERRQKELDFVRSQNTKTAPLKQAANEVLDVFYDAIESTSKRQQTAFGKRFTTAKGDYGIFDQEDISLIERVLPDGLDINERFTKVSEISEKFYNAAQSGEELVYTSSGNSQFLSEVQMMDLFASVIKDYDSGAGAYLFEYLLALITKGTVAGKQKTKAGRMGAVDFIYSIDDTNDIYGSSKFVRGGKSTQSISGFEDLYDGNPITVEYVITAKKSDYQSLGTSNVQKKGISSDPSKIIALAVWTPTVVYDGANFTYNGKTLKTEDKHVVLNVSDFGEPVGVIRLASVRTETFKEMLERGLEGKNSDLKEVFKAFQKYMKNLEEAEMNARLYSSTDDREKAKGYGADTFESLEKADAEFVKVVENMDDGHSIETDPSSLFPPRRTVKEGQKITADFLKKLISESFKK
jgi:hypothetical protein